MRTAVRRRNRLLPALLLLLLALLIGFAVFRLWPRPVDPHAGQVYLYDGFDWIWYTPLEGVAPNPWTAEDFELVGTRPVYKGTDYQVLRGIDVSEHQHQIDWTKLRGAGLDYACIRLGRRGYTEGGLFLDPFYHTNMNGALAAGLRRGVYFFSQAVNVQEAIEEANFVLTHLNGQTLDLPVVFDWEKVDAEDSRTRSLSLETRTDCAVAFCETIRAAGYTPGVYFNRNLGYYGYDLRRLTDYTFWFALPESGFPNFYYAVDAWQYSFTEQLPGIEVETDMNLMFVPVETEDTDNEE